MDMRSSCESASSWCARVSTNSRYGLTLLHDFIWLYIDLAHMTIDCGKVIGMYDHDIRIIWSAIIFHHSHYSTIGGF